MSSCCGKNLFTRDFSGESADPAPSDPAPRPASVRFRYGGERALSTRGAITGRIYRFSRPGEELLVDARDAPGMAGVPRLRRVQV